MLNYLRHFPKDETGAAAIEYNLIASGIALAIIPSIKEVGTKLVDIFTALQSAFN